MAQDGIVGEGFAFVLEWGVAPHPLSTGAGGWQGSQGSALSSPQSGSDPAPGMAVTGPVSSSCFWQDGQGGPGEAKGQPLGLRGWGPA